jgi:DNA-binding transcriptional MerR regulator
MRAKPEPVLSEQWTVGEMARRSVCTRRDIHFYEQRGLLLAKDRTSGCHRRHSSHELGRLHVILGLCQVGLTIDENRNPIELKCRHATRAAVSLELRKLLESRISTCDARLTQLRLIEGELEQLHEATLVCEDCDGDAKFPNSCAEREKLSAAAEDTSSLRALWNHSQ